MLVSLATALTEPGLSLLLDKHGAPSDAIVRALGREPDAWINFGSDKVRESVPVVTVLPAVGQCGSSFRDEPQLPTDRDHMLLRVRAPENATPGLNWALGLDATRIFEATANRQQLDWLIAIEVAEEEDIRERIECGVSGEAFRRDRRAESALTVETVQSGPRSTLVLPEACRVALATQSLPSGTDVMWRVAPFVRTASPLERCISPRPVRSCADSNLPLGITNRAKPCGIPRPCAVLGQCGECTRCLDLSALAAS